MQTPILRGEERGDLPPPPTPPPDPLLVTFSVSDLKEQKDTFLSLENLNIMVCFLSKCNKWSSRDKLKLAKSFFHTSNTRYITTQTNLQHGRRSAMALTESCHLCLAFILMFIAGEGTEESVGETEMFERNDTSAEIPPFARTIARPRALRRRCRGLHAHRPVARPSFCEVSRKSRE